MSQIFKLTLLNEVTVAFIKAGFLLLLISSEPFGEIVAMIDLLKQICAIVNE